ncbi:MAG: hypothetical protein ACTSU5_04260 [Promethearchaeota archaeon]
MFSISPETIAADPWGFAELVAMLLSVVAHFILGGKFLLSSRSNEKIESLRRVEQGYGAWFISIGLGYGTYVLDRFWRFFYEGNRFFTSYEDRVINRDYLLISFLFLAIAFTFLTFVIDKYLLNRQKPVLSFLCVALIALAILLRPLETAFYDPDDPPGLVSDVLGYVLYAGIAIVLITIVGLYVSVAKSSPEGSALRKKAVTAVLGIILWVSMLMFGNNQFDKAGWFPGVELLGPVVTIVALLVLNYSFSSI